MIRTDPYSRRTHPPYLAQRIEDLPAGLRRLAEPALTVDDPVETIYVVPRQMIAKKLEGFGGMRNVPDQALIFTAHGVLHVREASPSERAGQVAYVQASSLAYAHLTLVLLYGRLELCGTNGETTTTIVIEYSTVSHQLVQPALQCFLHMSWEQPFPVKPYNETTNRFLYEIRMAPYKFRRGLEDYALQSDERLVGCIVQPPITRRFLGVFRRKIAPPMLLTLTQHQLIIIEEGLTSATSLGWYFTFCPRAGITDIEFKPNDLWQDMVVHLRRGEVNAQRRTKVGSEAAQDWRALWSSQQ